MSGIGKKRVKSEPFIRIIKREGLKKQYAALFYVAAVLAALCIGALLLVSLDVDPINYYKKVLTIGMIGHAFPYKLISNFIMNLVPLLITSLALSLAFKMRFWNIGGEGQFILGALAGAAVAFSLPSGVNPYMSVILMALAGGAAGGLAGLLTAFLKVRFNTNETLFTLMLNYIALYMITYFGETKREWNFFLRADSQRPKFSTIPGNTVMPCIRIGDLSLNISFIFSVALVFLMYVYLKNTKQGYEISVVGDSMNTARYAGINVKRVICRTVFISAFLIGTAGAMHVSTSQSLSTSITNDVGWTGIIVAWLAELNSFAILLVSFLITVLRFGSMTAASEFKNIDSHFADLIQGIILFIVLAADFFIRFKIVINTGRRKSDEEAYVK